MGHKLPFFCELKVGEFTQYREKGEHIVAHNRRNTKRQQKDVGMEIDHLTQPKYCWESIEKMTSERLERILAKPEYQTQPFWDRNKLTPEEKAQVNQFESITSFGGSLANLFEDMMNQLGHIPTQKEYIEKGIGITQEWLIDNRKHPKVKGLPFNQVVRKACAERLARTWVSNIVEIHTKLLIQETLPNHKVFTHDLLDIVAGVDLVVEDSDRRYYVHIFKNTEWGMKAFKQKEKRGGLFKGKKFIKYKRNFSGDVILAYEWDTRTDHTSTKFINGIPLFKKDFIEWKFTMIQRKSLGEDLATIPSKLDNLQSWVKDNFNRTVTF